MGHGPSLLGRNASEQVPTAEPCAAPIQASRVNSPAGGRASPTLTGAETLVADKMQARRSYPLGLWLPAVQIMEYMATLVNFAPKARAIQNTMLGAKAARGQ